MMVGQFVEAISKHGLRWPALTLAVVHIVVFFVMILSTPPLPPPSTEPCPPDAFCIDPWEISTVTVVAGRGFHHDVVFRILSLVDLPALLLVGLPISFVSFILSSAGIWDPSRVTGSYVFVAVWLFVGTLQWWTIGIFLRARRQQ
jgi:hypothetical protein